MSTKFEVIIRITDSELGVAETTSSVSGDDYDDTADRFRDTMFFNGMTITERALENPNFEKEDNKKQKTAEKKVGGGVVRRSSGAAKSEK